jgi:hypothetical protein
MVTVPAFTPLFVRIDEELSSKKNKNGDRFRILMAADLRVGGAVVIPAGSVGEGEVIHESGDTYYVVGGMSGVSSPGIRTCRPPKRAYSRA